MGYCYVQFPITLDTQSSPKHKFDLVNLGSRTLSDLIPGKLHAVNINTLEDFGVYDNERHLWIYLNPNKILPILRLPIVLNTI